MIGSDVFSGYYGCNEITRRVLCEFNGEICYKTGDLGWLNTTNKQLELRGPCDHQLKPANQPINLEEIKAILMKMTTNCAVIKAKHRDTDHLLAYVQTTHTIRDLRQHCLASLPIYMIPSIFIILDILPVDQNGEIIQKNLPPPDFTGLSKLRSEEKLPRIEMEQRVHKIWYQVLSHVNSTLSISTSFFSLRDDPGSFIRLFNLYSVNFKHNLRITTFLKHPTIAEHARLLLENITLRTMSSDGCELINITEGE